MWQMPPQKLYPERPLQGILRNMGIGMLDDSVEGIFGLFLLCFIVLRALPVIHLSRYPTLELGKVSRVGCRD